MKSEYALFNRNRRGAWAAGLLSAGLAFSAWAASPEIPEIAVRERAAQRWQALVAGKTEQAYAFLAPSYRAITPLKRYQDSIGGAAVWTGADVVAVNCNPAGDTCTAQVRIAGKPALGPRLGSEISTHVEEAWVKQKNQWWMAPRS